MRIARTLGLVGVLAALLGVSSAQASVTQPAQPESGPGGSSHTHGFRVHAGGTGADAWYVFEPTKPRPIRAPLAIVTHGYFEFSGHASLSAFIKHTVRRGTIVIYPRWQTDTVTPCPGPFDIEPCMQSELNGIRGALAYLQRDHPHRKVQPRLGKTSYFGFSFGGIITANLANRYRALNLPKPRAVFLDDPEDSGLAGQGEPALDDSLAGIPSSTLFQCHSGADGAAADHPNFAANSCNAVFPKLTTIPDKHRDLVLTHTDDHGQPKLSSDHGVCASGSDPGGAHFGPANAYDWNFCWKVWDALRTCALSGRQCRYALGNTREHRLMGRWSDGTPVKRLKIQNSAPILP